MMKDRVKDYIKENNDYKEVIEKVVDYVENNKNPDKVYIEDTDYEACFEYSDVGCHPTRLHQLEVEGVLERVFDSNSSTIYAVNSFDEVKEAIDEIEDEIQGGTEIVDHSFPDEDELPDDMFDSVVGFDDVKWLLKRGITSDEITNFLLIGPPGSAKTVFLLCLNRFNDSEYLFGPDVSSSGFNEMMFNKKPKYVLIDELDDMDKSEQKSLSSYTETGIVKETKYGKDREMEINSKTVAAGNKTEGILDHIEDRFTVIEFEEYTPKEFFDICTNMLPKEEDVTEEEAKDIADALWESKHSTDIREAIQVARLSRGDPKKVIDVLSEYSDSGLSGTF